MRSGEFVWTDEWLSRDDPSLAMPHAGIVVLGDGSIALGTPEFATLAVRDTSGRLIDRVAVEARRRGQRGHLVRLGVLNRRARRGADSSRRVSRVMLEIAALRAPNVPRIWGLT